VKFYLQLTPEEAQLIPSHKESGRTFPEGANQAARLKRTLTYPTKRLAERQAHLLGLENDLRVLEGEGGGAFEQQERYDFLLKRQQELEFELASLSGTQTEQVLDK
jgi:hypothetical protein